MSEKSKSWPIFLAEPPEPWQPSADVYRTKDGWLVKFDLAGVQIGDVTVGPSRPALGRQWRSARLVPRGGLQLLLHGDLV